MANIALVLVLVAIVVGTATDRAFALWFCGSAAATLVVFRAGGWLLMAAARRAGVRRPVPLRLGVANLFRPASQAPLLLVALGLGLTTLARRRPDSGQHPPPDPGPTARGRALVLLHRHPEYPTRPVRADRARHPGTADLHQVPSLRARIVSLKGVPVDQVHVKPGSEWRCAAIAGLTYSADVPRGSIVVSGQWWPADYDGPPLPLAGCRAGEGWGIHLGDTIRVNVLGRDLDLKVANLRAIQWRQLAINFALVASPGLLEHAPHMHIATVREPPPRTRLCCRR